MIRSIPILAVALSACDFVAEVQARAGYAHLSLGGGVGLAASPDDPSGTDRVSIEDELGLGASGSPYAGVGVATAAGRLQVAALRYADAGEGVVQSSFGDIPPGTPVRTEIDLANVKAIWAFDLLALGPLHVSPGVGVDWFDVDTRVSSITPISVFERFSVRAPVPMLFVNSAVDLGIVDAELEIGGMSLSLGDVDGTFWDVEARLAVEALSGVELFGGYRYISMDARGASGEQGYDADLVLQGWTIGGGVRF